MDQTLKFLDEDLVQEICYGFILINYKPDAYMP